MTTTRPARHGRIGDARRSGKVSMVHGTAAQLRDLAAQQIGREAVALAQAHAVLRRHGITVDPTTGGAL